MRIRVPADLAAQVKAAFNQRFRFLVQRVSKALNYTPPVLLGLNFQAPFVYDRFMMTIMISIDHVYLFSLSVLVDIK